MDNKPALEQQLNDIAQLLYQSHEVKFVPKPPWVLVRVLPRHQKFGSIILPGDKQKPVHEGIVLRTWEPYTPKKYTRLPHGIAKDNTEELEVQSELSPGDHVVFPYWAGLPVPGYDEHNYRIVKECSWTLQQDGGIFATLDYNEKGQSPAEALSEEVTNASTVYAISDRKLAIDAVVAKYVIMTKNQGSVTISSTKQE